MSGTALSLAILTLCLCMPVTIAGMNISAGLMTAALVWQALAGEKVPWRAALHPAFYLILVYIVTALIASFMAVDPDRCGPDLQRDFHKVWIVGLFLIALTREPSPRAYQALAAAFVFIAVVGLYQAMTQKVGDGVPEELMARMRAHAFVHPVTYGQLMTIALLGGISFWNKSGAGVTEKRLRRLIPPFLALIMAALVFSQTRGAFVALVAGFGALCLVDKGVRRYGYWALAAGVAAVLLLEVIPGQDRSITRTLLKDGFFKGDNNLNPQFHRLILWKVAIEMFMDYPFLGIGLGNYKTAFVSYFQGKVDGQWVWHSAHNIYLHQLAERGILGFAVLLALLGYMTRRAYRRAKEAPNGPNLWAWASYSAFLVMNLTEAAFQVELLATLVLFIWIWAEVSHPTGSGRRPAGRSSVKASSP